MSTYKKYDLDESHWMTSDMKDIIAQQNKLIDERELLLRERLVNNISKERDLEITLRLRDIKVQFNALKQEKNKTSEQMNAHYVDIVRDALGKSHNYIHQRILTEVCRRIDGMTPQTINIFPDDMIDAMSDNRQLSAQRMAAEAKVHAVRRLLEESRLSMKGNLIGFEYERRKSFNILIDKLLNRINQ